jgi:flagellar L-ring protein precursor FlgH
MSETRSAWMPSLQRGLACMLALVSQLVLSAGLYQESTFQALSSDRKANRPGDLITVLIYENASATSTADTNSDRRGSFAVALDRPSRTSNIGLSSNSQMDNTGRTAREGRVVAQMTVAVRDIAANGDLIVAGGQSLEINNERQQIRVEGRVRRQDISESNTVFSTRLADATISFVGFGDLADRQRASWWQRALTWFGL